MTSRAPEPPKRRRIDRVGGSVLAVLGIAVAIVALLALRHPNGRQARPVSQNTATVTATATQTVQSSPTESHPRTSASSSHAVQRKPLIVLNSTTTQGLADTARERFEAGGWKVTYVDNIVNDILSTCAYYDPSDPANRRAALALQRQFPQIQRVKEKFTELPSGPIVVVLTTDYS